MAETRGTGETDGEHSHLPANDGEALRAIESVPYFAGLSDKVRRDILKSLEWELYRGGVQIIARDDQDKDVFFLISGTANVLNFSPAGRVVSYGTLKAGEFFGEIAAIDGLSRSATVAAKSNCLVAVMSANDFLRTVTTCKDCMLTVMRKHASIIRAGNERIDNFALLGAEQRICLELLRLAEPDPAVKGRLTVYPVPTQEFIAGNVGVTRRTVARAFSRLLSNNVINRHGKTLYIRDADRLQEIVLS